MRRQLFLTALAALALGAAPAVADVWDLQTDNDNSASSTDNELVHGTLQIHDLAGTVDQDYYVIGQKPFSSYEMSGGIWGRGTSGPSGPR